MTDWKLSKLQDVINKNKVIEKYAALQIIRSISEANQIFNYHCSTAKNTIGKHHSRADQASKEMVIRVLGGSENASQYTADVLVHQTHCISAALTLRAMYDMLAQLVRELLLPAYRATISLSGIDNYLGRLT